MRSSKGGRLTSIRVDAARQMEVESRGGAVRVDAKLVEVVNTSAAR